MLELPALFSADALVRDRIQDLNDAAAQLHATSHAAAPHPGLVPRMRAAIGRELITIGRSVAGQHV